MLSNGEYSGNSLFKFVNYFDQSKVFNNAHLCLREPEYPYLAEAVT